MAGRPLRKPLAAGSTEGEGVSETAEERRQRRHEPVKIVRRRVFEGFSAGGVRRPERRHWCPTWGKNAQGAQAHAGRVYLVGQG
jgi:hypothetical protein